MKSTNINDIIKDLEDENPTLKEWSKAYEEEKQKEKQNE